MGESFGDMVKRVKQTQMANLKYNFGDIKYSPASDVYAYLKGRTFGAWIDLSGRSNSFDEGDLIENPVYVIESVIRDMLSCEYDLVVSNVDSASGGEIVFNGSSHALINTSNDYYNNAYLVNIDQNWTKKITNHTGSFKVLDFGTSLSGVVAVGDRCYITNIKGNDLIDESVFDTTATSRSSWKVSLCLDNQIEGYSLIDQLAYECQCSVYKVNGQYRIKPIGAGTSVGTLSKPLIEKGGNPLIDIVLSSVEDIYTEFVVNYAFLPQENKYFKSLTCDKNESNHTDLTSTYRGYCGSAESNYKLSRRLEVNLDFIYDEDTAIAFMQRLIKEKTFQRLIVGYIGDVKNHIKYEKGDLVLINYSDKIPTSKNNSTQFLITKAEPSFKRGSAEVKFKLVEQRT